MALALVPLALATGLVALDTRAPSASAATLGPGYGAPGVGSGPLRAFVAESDGKKVYCLDVGAPSPTQGVTSGPQVISDLREDHSGAQIAPDSLARANAGLTLHGQSSEDNWGAALSLFVWSELDTADYNSHGMSGDQWFITRAPTNQRADILNKLAQVRSEVAGVTAAGSTQGTANLVIEMFNPYEGQVTVAASPADAEGTLRLEGAHVAGSNATTAPVRNGSVVQISGVPADDAVKYRITAKAHFTGKGGYAGNVSLYTTPGKQRTINAGTPGTTNFDTGNFVTDPLSTVFSPVVGTTVASKFVKKGQPFVDTLLAQVAPGSERWRTLGDGTSVPVVTRGTLYGPFSAPPGEEATPPAGAPVVGRDTVELRGPGVYESSGALVSDEAGYYTWVWTIDAAVQPGVSKPFLPAGYVFADRFGLVAESHITPSSVVAVSHVAKLQVPLSGDLVDGIEVSLRDRAWLRDKDGHRVPVVFRGTAYHVPGETAPVVSPEVPAEAVILGERKLTVTGPGSFDTSADPLKTPGAIGGFVSWVWRILEEDQPVEHRGVIAEWSDAFGLPDETVKILTPIVTSKAQAAVSLGSPATDIAIISGTLPATPSTVTFEAFLQPIDATNPVCEPENRVFDTEGTPITVTETGEYTSAPATFEKAGTYFWVETLTSTGGEVISRGECGAPGETTVVTSFTVSSDAVEHALEGDAAHDVAIVSGEVPERTTVHFEAFEQTTSEPVCEPENRVFSSVDAPVQLTAGMNNDTRYPGPAHTFDKAGTYFWIETATLKDGTVQHTGACGAENETTMIAGPPEPQAPPALPAASAPSLPLGLAFTGWDARMLDGVFVGGALALMAGITVVILTRRHRARVDGGTDPDNSTL